MTTSVAIVDDHPLLAHGLRLELTRAGYVVSLIVPTSRAETVRDILSFAPDLALVDLDLPIESGGLGLIKTLGGRRSIHATSVPARAGSSWLAGDDGADAPSVRTAVLTGSADRSLWARSLESGAAAVIAKTEPLDQIIDYVHRLVGGEDIRPHQRIELAAEYRRLSAERSTRQQGFEQLSQREAIVLSGLMAGLNPSLLAERDSVSVDTVRSQIKSVLLKLRVRSQLAAVARAYEADWTPIRAGGTQTWTQ